MSETISAATELETPVHTVRLESTNHDGSFLGKNLAPKKFAASAGSGFAMADLLFGLDLGNAPTFGFAFPNGVGMCPTCSSGLTCRRWCSGRRACSR